jgi:hypothetical protein
MSSVGITGENDRVLRGGIENFANIRNDGTIDEQP